MFKLGKTALDNCEKFNVLVVTAVLNKFYTDNYLDFVYNLQQAITTIDEIKTLLTVGGFNFLSNNHIIIKTLSPKSLL